MNQAYRCTRLLVIFCRIGVGQMMLTGAGNPTPVIAAEIPAGMIAFVDSGSCPVGWTALSSAGNYILLTTPAAGGVGTTGGSTAYTPGGTVAAPVFTGSSLQQTSSVSGGTPAGTVAAPIFTGSQGTTSIDSAGTPSGTSSAPSFTGTLNQATSAITAGTPAGTISWPAGVPAFAGLALATHAHELPWQIASTTTIRQIAVAAFGTGTSRAATAVSAAGTANTTSAAVALSQAISGGTPAGTITWPAGVPVFSGALLGTHSHTLTPGGTVAAPVFTGVPLLGHSHTLTALGTLSAPLFTGSALAGHAHTVTPAGTNNAPAFSGTPATIQPPFLKLIACRKD